MKIRVSMMALLLLVLTSCTNVDSKDARPTSWEIVGHQIPGISAMSNEEAQAYYGRPIQFGPKQAVSGPETCDQRAKLLARHL